MLHPSSRQPQPHSLSRRARAGVAGCVLLAGCASYQPLPLAQAPDLAPTLAQLRTALPADPRSGAAEHVDLTPPLDIDRVALLAILNDPGLAASRGEHAAAQAALLQASLLPNPSVGLGYEALLAGPATQAAYTASLSQDIGRLVTYRRQRAAQRASAEQVDADLLWQQWQVAQKARLLALDIYWSERSIGLLETQAQQLDSERAQLQAAVGAGNLDLSTLAPLQSALAAAAQALAAQKLDQLKNWQALDALLGLQPSARFAIATPRPAAPVDKVDARIADLPDRRPDLVALRLGYRASDETLRAAILGQFPALVLGGSWNEDTSGVRSAGPTVSFDLPLFDRKQGAIAEARATRDILHAQYQARLDDAVASIRALQAQDARLSADLGAAAAAADTAEAQLRTAQAAYAQGNLDLRALGDYQSSAFERQSQLYALQRSRGELRIALGLELGQGLPYTRLAAAKGDDSL
jgi:outer membrane protein TolC